MSIINLNFTEFADVVLSIGFLGFVCQFPTWSINVFIRVVINCPKISKSALINIKTPIVWFDCTLFCAVTSNTHRATCRNFPAFPLLPRAILTEDSALSVPSSVNNRPDYDVRFTEILIYNDFECVFPCAMSPITTIHFGHRSCSKTDKTAKHEMKRNKNILISALARHLDAFQRHKRCSWSNRDEKITQLKILIRIQMHLAHRNQKPICEFIYIAIGVLASKMRWKLILLSVVEYLIQNLIFSDVIRMQFSGEFFSEKFHDIYKWRKRLFGKLGIRLDGLT